MNSQSNTSLKPFSGLLFVLFFCCVAITCCCTTRNIPHDETLPNSNSRLYAVLVTTNLVSQPCTCGFCRPELGIAVPEHINQIGYDLRIEVSTNYLPIVHK